MLNDLDALDDFDAATFTMPPDALVLDPGTLAKPAKPGGAKEQQRRATRYPAHWRVALPLDDGRVLQARSVNVSGSGIAIHCAEALPVRHRGTLHLEIPPRLPAAVGGRRLVLQIEVRTVYTVHDFKAQCFRSGLQFVGFNGDGDVQLLRELERHFPGFKEKGGGLL